MRERHAASLDPDQRDAAQVRIGLDDLVRNPGQRALEALAVEQDLLRGNRRRQL
jgi:hypothetical protein